MTQNELKKRYFKWMCRLVCNNKRSKEAFYQNLLSYLHETEFTYIIPMDSNRAADGIELRYRFAYEQSYDWPTVSESMSDYSCSIFEMMVALAVRCKENIMDETISPNPIGELFWEMISNLGLEEMTNDNFDEIYTKKVLNRFLFRKYKRNGEGGLFTIPGCKNDLRLVEIWYQMCWYIDDVFEGGE